MSWFFMKLILKYFVIPLTDHFPKSLFLDICLSFSIQSLCLHTLHHLSLQFLFHHEIIFAPTFYEHVINIWAPVEAHTMALELNCLPWFVFLPLYSGFFENRPICLCIPSTLFITCTLPVSKYLFNKLYGSHMSFCYIKLYGFG